MKAITAKVMDFGSECGLSFGEDVNTELLRGLYEGDTVTIIVLDGEEDDVNKRILMDRDNLLAENRELRSIIKDTLELGFENWIMQRIRNMGFSD